MSKSSIEWTHQPGFEGWSWSPFRSAANRALTHCEKLSEGCTNCWASRQTFRLEGRPFAHGADTSVLDQRALAEPLHWRNPRCAFVCPTTDLFLADHGEPELAAVWHAMTGASNHRFLVLTKRADRMASVWSRWAWLDHIWPGVTAENQRRLDERLPHLKAIDSRHRWLSLEPLLGPIDLRGRLDGISWCVVGAESGPGARECRVEWIRDIVTACAEAGVSCFVKQLPRFFYEQIGPETRAWFLRHPRGASPAEWPSDLQVRQFPKGGEE